MVSFFKINMRFYTSLKIRFLMSFFYGLFPTLLLFILNPFDLGVFFYNNAVFTFGYGMVASVYIFLIFGFANQIYKRDEIWNIFRILLLYLFILFTVSFLIFQYHLFGKNLQFFKSLTYLNILLLVFLISLMPTIIIRLIIKLSESKPSNINVNTDVNLDLSNFESKLNDEKNDTELASNIKQKGGNEGVVIIKSAIIKEKDIKLNCDAILYIKSDNNYCHIYYLNENNDVKNKMMRITLKQIESQLEGFNMFFRCHNSYVVNKNKVEQVIGNSTNRKIKILNTDYLIPISRKIEFNF